MAGPVVANFNAGEWSPALYGRVDLQKYYSACEMLENMSCRPHGPAVKRPGTQFVWESLGGNVVTNGTFDDGSSWNLGAGWSIYGGYLQGFTGTASFAWQTLGTLKTGKLYEVCFTLSYCGGGSVRPILGSDQQTPGQFRSTNGTYRETLLAKSTTNFTISFEKTADFGGHVDDVYLREVAPKTRLITFNFSTEQNYVLALTERNMRFFKDEGIILGTDGLPYELVTPFTETDLFDLNFTQSADIFYFAHHNYRPQKLERYGHANWVLSTIEFESWPGIVVTGVDKVPAESGSEHRFRVDAPDHGLIPGDDIVIWDVVGAGTSINAWHNVHDTTSNTFKIRNTDPANWTDYESGGKLVRIAKITAATQTNPVVVTAPNHRWGNGDRIWICDVQGMTELNDLAFEIIDKTKDTFALKNIDGTGYAAYTSSGRADRIGEDFSLEGHHPSCVEFYEERLFWANTENKPQTIWGSVVGDYENVRLGAADDDAVAYTLAAKGVNPILWIVPQNKLLLGTIGAEWWIGSSTLQEPLTATNVQAKRQSTWGSKSSGALLVNDVVLFVQRAGTKIREFIFSFEQDSYVAPDLTVLAEHIIKNVVSIAYQQEPISMFWCINYDGGLSCMVYERNQDVVGWSRFVTQGKFKSITVVATTNAEDCVWVVVEREIDGKTRQYIEFFKPWEWDETNRPEKCFFVDSGLSYDGGDKKDICNVARENPVILSVVNHGFAEDERIKVEDVLGTTELNGNTYIVKARDTDTFYLHDLNNQTLDGTGFTAYASGGTAKRVVTSCSGLEHLENVECAIVADGIVMNLQTVVDGNIQLENNTYANQIHVGLAYTAKLKPMNLEAGQQEGTAQGKVKRIHSLKARFQNTMACKIGSCEEDLEEIPFRKDSDASDVVIQPFTGDKELTAFPGSYQSDGNILVVSDIPLPLTVVALMPRLRTYDGYR